MNKNTLQLGTIQGTQPDTQTNYLEGLTWKDGQFNDSTGVMGTGTDKCITDIKLPATGLYTLSATVNYNYFKIFIFDNYGKLIASTIGGINSKTVSIYVYDPNCRISISLFPNSLSFDENNVSLKYVHSLANTTGKDVDIQASVIANPSLLTTSGDYKIIELYANKIYDDVSAIKLGSTIYKIINTIINLNASQANISITRMNNGYCTKGAYEGKTLFNVSVPSTWGETATDIANYIQTNNVAVVINPSEYLNSADKISTMTINEYQLVPTVEPSNTTDTVIWTVSPEGILTVNNGLVKAVSNGETTVTATCGSRSTTCNVTVSGIISGGEVSTTWTNGYLLRGNSDTSLGDIGTVKTTSTDITSDFIPCTENDTFTIEMENRDYGMGVVAYDNNKNYLSTLAIARNASTDALLFLKWANYSEISNSQNINQNAIAGNYITLGKFPINTSYIRICYNDTTADNFIIHRGNGTYSPDIECPIGFTKFVFDGNTELDIPDFPNNESGKNGSTHVEYIKKPLLGNIGNGLIVPSILTFADISLSPHITNLFTITRWNEADYFILSLPTEKVGTALESIKAWLTNNPVTIYYKA